MTMELAKQLNEHKDILNAQGEAFKDMKTVLEKYGDNSAEGKAAIEKIDAKFEDFEKKNQDLMTSFESRNQEQKELIETVKDLEAKLARPGAGNMDPEKQEAKANMAALNTFARIGLEAMGVEARNDEKMMSELKRLRTDSNVDGGYLVEAEYVREILKDITEVSSIRSIARVRQTARKTVFVPTRTARVASGWNGEGIAAIVSNSKYGLEEITMGKLSVATIISNEELSDSSFNMEVEIRDDVAEEFARAEGEAFVSGDAINKPEGFLVNPDVQAFISGTIGAIDADDLIDITGQLKTGYNPTFVLNRRTLATIRQLKDGNGQYLWAPGIASGLPNTIIGEPYVSAIDMPDIATGQDAIAYGDFRRGYWIVDRTSMTMIRDPFTRSGTDEVVLTFHRRLTGQVVKAEAIKKITVQ